MQIDFEPLTEKSSTIQFEPLEEIDASDIQSALNGVKANAGTMIRPFGTSTIAGGPPLSIPSGALRSTLETALEEAERPPVELPRFEERPGQTGLESGLKGLANVGAGLAEFISSPAGLAITATGPVGHALGLGWGLATTPEVARQAGEISVTGTPQQKVETLAGLGLIGGGTALGAMVGALRANRGYQSKNLVPQTAEALKQVIEPPKGVEPNASQIPSPSSVIEREVRPRLGEEAPLRQQGEITQVPEEVPTGQKEGEVLLETKSPPVKTGATTQTESPPTVAERPIVTREAATSPPSDISQAKPGVKETQPTPPTPTAKAEELALPQDPKSVLLREWMQKATDLDNKSRWENDTRGGIAAGATGFDAWLKSETTFEFLRNIRKGMSADEAAKATNEYAREAVAKHNAKRPKDYNWQRDKDTGETHIRRIAEDFRAIEQKPTTPEAKAKEPWEIQSISREDGGVYVIASSNGKELGSAIVKNLGDNVYELNEIKVNESERGKGIGTKLYTHAADEVHKKGGKLYTSPELTESGKGLVESLDKSGLLGDNARVKGSFRREIVPVQEPKRMATSRETPATQPVSGSPIGAGAFERTPDLAPKETKGELTKKPKDVPDDLWLNEVARKTILNHEQNIKHNNELIKQINAQIQPLLVEKGTAESLHKGSESQRRMGGLGPNALKAYKLKQEISGLREQAKNLRDRNVAEKKLRDSFITSWEQGKEQKPSASPDLSGPGTPSAAQGEGGVVAGSVIGTGLTPAPTSVTTLPPKSQDQIIRDLSKGLKLPIRFGRLTSPKWGGYYKKVADIIASKKAVDVPVVSHEVGHKLETTFNFSRDPSIHAELDWLGDNTRPGSRSSWTPSKTRQYKLEEGVAEFTRYWLTDPAEARTLAPTTYRLFENALDANKDFGDTMRTAQEDIRLWRTADAQARLRSHVSTSNPNKTPYTLSQLTRDLVNDLYYLRLAVDDAGKGLGHPVNVMADPYLAARNLRGSFGMAETFINKGVADFNTKAVQMGTSLEDVLKPVAGRINDFRDWIVAKRAQELHRNGKATGLVDSDVNTTASNFDADTDFQRAFQGIKDWNDAVLKYAVDSGLVTADGARAMRAMNQDYVPFHRLFEVGAGEMPATEGSGVGRGLNLGTPGSLHKQKGSVRPIIDPLETMIKNAYALITASEKSMIHRQMAGLSHIQGMGKWIEKIATPKEHIKVGIEKLRQQLETAGADLTAVPDDLMLDFYRNSGQAPWGENIIKVKINGENQFYRLNKDLFETFNALDYEDSGKIIRMMGGTAQLLRAGVTLTPDFALSNAMRDAFSSSIISKHWLIPGEATLRGVAALLRNPKLVAEWAASGGKHSVEINYFDRAKLQDYLTKKITKDFTSLEKASIVVKSPLTALRMLSGSLEEATRIGEYQTALNKYLKQGMPEGEARRLAAYESRDRQDFSKGGAHTKTLRMLTPFWNAALQANVKFLGAIRERPFQTAIKGLAFITLPKLVEQAVNWDDKDYWDRPQWERDLFFLIPRGKDANGHTKYIRIPVPFEPGIVFASLPGRFMQWAKKNQPEAVKEFPGMFLKNAIPNPIPPPIQVLFQDFLSGKQGWDIFRERPVVPDSVADLPPELQWTEQTSLTARKAGKLLGMSPMKVDHIIAQTTGGLGKQVTYNVIDRAISVMTGEKTSPIGAIPGMRFVTTPAGISSQAVETFYQYNSDVQGDAQAVKKSPGYKRQYPGAQSMFNDAVDHMARLRKQIRRTEDQDEKQRLYLRITEIAKRVNTNFERRFKNNKDKP